MVSRSNSRVRTKDSIWTYGWMPEGESTADNGSDSDQQHERQTTMTMTSLGNNNPDSTRSLSSSSSSSLTCHPIPLTVPTSSNAVNPYADHHPTPIVIGHRGASSHLPEHSLPAYRLALELGADYIEPDLVSTSDRHLVALHSLDLAATTDVAEKFPGSRKTPSNYLNGEEGYWIYTFTLEEVKQLRLKQRLSNEGRTQVFDGLFEVPTLTEILELLLEWNSSIQPRRYNPNATILPINIDDASDNNNNNIHYERKPPGPGGRLYAELKDSPWLLEDASIDLVELLFDHMTTTTTMASSSSSNSTSELPLSLWHEALFQYMCDTKVVSTDYSYKLPPLVLQAFQPSVLQNFTRRWEQYSTTENGDDQQQPTLFTYQVPTTKNDDTINEDGDGDVSSTATNLPLPVPPTILLVPHEKCHDFDHFWDDIQSSYRDYVKGIGPDKNCFFSKMNGNGDTNSNPSLLHVLQRDIMDLAVKMDWVVHPWTERPETSFIVSPAAESDPASQSASLPYFSNVLEELIYMKCVVGVHGVFSESVDVAVRAMNMPCPAGFDLLSFGESTTGVVSHQTAIQSPSKPSSSLSSTLCPTTTSQNNASAFFNDEKVPLGPVIFLSFTMGMVVALVIWCCWQRFVLCRRRRRGGISSGADGISKNVSSALSKNDTGNYHDHAGLTTSGDDGNDDDDDDDDKYGGDLQLELTDADRDMI